MKLSDKQKEFWNEPYHRWNIKYGATRTGKTYMDYFIIPRRIRERVGKEGLTVLLGNTKGTLQRNIIEPMQSIYGTALVTDIRSDNTAMLFGERVHCLGADNKKHVNKIRGLSIKYCYGDEVVTWNKEVFGMLKSRLDRPYSCFDGTCNPEGLSHWFKEFLDSDADIFAQKYSIFDNPFLDPGVKAELMKEHSGVYYERYILGEWAIAEGLIYGQFAANQHTYTKEITQEWLRDVEFVSIGIDFGGTRSLTAFVATAVHRNFSKLTVLADHHIKGKKGDIDADRVCSEFVGFIQRLRTRYPRCYIKYVFADSEAQYLINSLVKTARQNALGVEIGDSAKYRIIDRIQATNTLLNTGRLFVSEECELVIGGLRSAVWATNKDGSMKEDTRLDNGFSDIDILDGFEYSFERFIPRLCPNLKVK